MSFMKVEVRLFATLRAYLPPGNDGTKAVLEFPTGARLGDVIERLGIPPQLAQLVMIDGLHETDRDRILLDGATVSIFPPVAGGSHEIDVRNVSCGRIVKSTGHGRTTLH
jgi:molybdopterin converting factor small subunit